MSAGRVTIANLIGGELVEPLTGEYLAVTEPATGAHVGDVPLSGAPDVERAVHSARKAFPAWASTPATERSRLMLRLADLVERDLESLARAESIDSGKPISLARSVDIPRAAANLRFFATSVLHAEGVSHATDAPAVHAGAGAGGAINYTLRQARGVAGCISPWNLPLYLFTWKIAPALATGNTVVAKPSEVTPVTAFRLAELSLEAGLPPGVLNILHGLGPACGGPIVTHPDVPAISFTGSTGVGRWIAEHAGPMFKRLSLELGGKNPTIIFDDADLDAAIPGATRAAFANQGQICLCGSRLLVHEKIYDSVLEGLVDGAKRIVIGDPLDETTQHGSLVSEDHLAKVAGYVDLAREQGGAVHCGGEELEADALPERCAAGSFYPPTVISGLANDSRVVQEEIFGPVVTVQSFKDEAEAVRLANSTPYGLAASVWTTDASRAHRVSAALESGIVWVNCWMLRDLRTPFGGMKQSGVGREGGTEALKFFTEAKNVCVGL